MKEWVEDILCFFKALFIGATASTLIVFIGAICAFTALYFFIKVINFLF